MKIELGNIAVPIIAAAAIAVLKVVGVISCSWWWVLMPLGLYVLINAAVGVAFILVYKRMSSRDAYMRSRRKYKRIINQHK